MVKVTDMKNTDYDSNSYKVSLFADTKEDLTSGEPIIGLPEGATIEMGSDCITASGEIAFMKSTGDWNWV